MASGERRVASGEWREASGECGRVGVMRLMGAMCMWVSLRHSPSGAMLGCVSRR